MQTGGHHAAFLQHIVRHWPQMLPDRTAVVVAAPATIAQLGHSKIHPTLKLQAFSPAPHGSGWWATRQSAGHWQAAITQYRPRRSFALYANTFSFCGRLVRSAPRLRAILMRPVTPLDHLTSRRLGSQLTCLKRTLVTRWWGQAARAERVFLLNDAAGAAALNDRQNTSVFRPLPDPLSISFLGQQPDGKKLEDTFEFLLPGAYTRRKGGEVVLAALAKIPQDIRAKLRVRFLGRPALEVDARRLRACYQRWTSRGIELPVEFSWDTVNDAAWAGAFARCDAVLLPYRDFHGSSGVLGEAAAAGKPVLTTNENLLGRLVPLHGLGLTVNPRQPQELASGMQKILQGDDAVDSVRRRDWLQDRDGETFVRELLAA